MIDVRLSILNSKYSILTTPFSILILTTQFNSKYMNITALITECEAEIENIKTLPYYTIFNRWAEQEADLQKLEEKLTDLKSVLAGTQIDNQHIKQITILQFNFSNFNFKS
jgi:hypothetical protein